MSAAQYKWSNTNISQKNKIKHQTIRQENVFFCSDGSKLFAKPDGEPVENLNKGDKADSETKSADAAKAGNEV